MSRSLNKVSLIGNLTRDPELRYTPQGTAVCTFGLATNRQWVTESGERKEDVEFHRIVAWDNHGASTGGPNWWFQTGEPNFPPEFFKPGQQL